MTRRWSDQPKTISQMTNQASGYPRYKGYKFTSLTLKLKFSQIVSLFRLLVNTSHQKNIHKL